MPSKIYPIQLAQSVAQASLVPTRSIVLSGDGAVSLATSIIACSVCERKQVRFICGDNRFDPYAVARYAKRRGLRPEDALNSILIARAFTAYQLVELVHRLDAKDASSLVVISGLCSSFMDEDISFVDAARLFYRALWRVVELARSGMTLLLVQGQMPDTTRRAYFLKDLCSTSDIRLRLGGKHTFSLDHHRRIELPRMAAMPPVIGD